MGPRRIATALAALLLVLAVTLAVTGALESGSSAVVDSVDGLAAAAGQTSDPATPSAAARPTPTDHTVVALGDSVPSGHACHCESFPRTYGRLLARRAGGHVSVSNLAVNGLQTAGLLGQLKLTRVKRAVAGSDIVLITIGANDFGDHRRQVVTGQCGDGGADCVADELATLRRHLTTILGTIRALRGNAPTTVLVTGYWNVFQDGAVALKEVGEPGLRASLRLTRRANAAIRSASVSGGAHYVDLLAAFEASGRDITALLAADGDHPDAAGHVLIAQALLRAGLPRVR